MKPLFLLAALFLPLLSRAEPLPLTVQLTAEEIVAYTRESPSFAACLNRLSAHGAPPSRAIVFLRLPSDRDSGKEVRFEIESLDERDSPVRLCVRWRPATRAYSCSFFSQPGACR